MTVLILLSCFNKAFSLAEIPENILYVIYLVCMGLFSSSFWLFIHSAILNLQKEQILNVSKTQNSNEILGQQREILNNLEEGIILF